MLSAVDFRLRRLARHSATFLIVVTLALLSAGCKRAGKATEVAYVGAPQVNLRDRVAALYNKTGMVYNGERLEILEKGKRFVKVRSPRGEVGWMEQRYLISAEVYDEFTKLAAENKDAAAQAHAVTRAALNMHVTPGRDSEHLFQLKEAEKVEVLRRATAEKPEVPGAVPTRRAKLAAKKDGKEEKPAGPPLEDWLLVRNAQGRAGWVLSRMVDVDAPMEIAQYAEGQRIVAYFVLNEVQDADKKVAQYITLTTEPRDGLPWDFNQARIFTWNVKRHRYETAYRERNLNGVFPAKVGSEDFGKEGTLPVFVLRVRDDAGNVTEKKYRLIGPIVRRVYAPGEEQREKEARAARMAARAGRR